MWCEYSMHKEGTSESTSECVQAAYMDSTTDHTSIYDSSVR